MGSSVSGFEVLRQTFEVINPEAVVAGEDVARQVTLEAVPVVALRLPLLQGKTQQSTSLGDPPLQPAEPQQGEETQLFLPAALIRTSAQVYRRTRATWKEEEGRLHLVKEAAKYQKREHFFL